MNIRLVIEYDGTSYHGYQIQKNGNSVQEELENALKKLVRDPFILYCAGRTDTGVHAKGQVCNFKCENPKVPVTEMQNALNGILPKDISVKECETVSEDFNSRYSAKERIYRYVILNSQSRSPIAERYSWHVKANLSLEDMQKAASFLEGTHDFRAFTCASFTETCVRNVNYIKICRDGEFVNIDISANAFTRSMVRNIVGTLTEVGRGKRKVKEIQFILHSEDRRNAGLCAPAKGLFLLRIEY